METWAHVIFVLLEKDELVKQMREKSRKNKAYSFRKFNNNLRLFLEAFFFNHLCAAFNLSNCVSLSCCDFALVSFESVLFGFPLLCSSKCDNKLPFDVLNERHFPRLLPVAPFRFSG